MKTRFILFLLAIPFLLGSTTCAQEKEEPARAYAVKIKPGKSGWLGVSTREMTPKLARKLDVKIEEGALVLNVLEDSPAEKAGFKEDDIIVEFAGKRIDDGTDLLHAVRKTKPGTTVDVVINRKNERKTLTVTVGKVPRHAENRVITIPSPPSPPRIRIFSRFETYGMRLVDLNEQLGSYFEVPGGKGALVEYVEKASSGEKAGFRAGDVIVKAGTETVEDVDDFMDALGETKEGEKVGIDIVRKGARSTLTLVAEENDHHRVIRIRKGHAPDDLEDIDIEVVPDGDLEGFMFEKESLRKEMEELKAGLTSAGREIRRQMKGVRKEILKALNEASI